VPPHLCDQDVENHHGLYWKHDGVLEASFNKMADTRGRLKPEKVHNFVKPLTYFMSMAPLVYWKSISRETNDNAKERLAMQVSKNGRRYLELDGPTIQPTKRSWFLNAILIQMVFFPFPGATYNAYWQCGGAAPPPGHQ
jgi:hypothetical protein